MKFWMKLLAPVLVLGLAAAAHAGPEGGKKKGHGLKGKVVSVAADGSSIVLKGNKKNGNQDVTVQTDAATVVEIDGVGGKSVKDLQPGGRVKITPATGVAREIKATTHAKAKGEKRAKGEGKKGKKRKEGAGAAQGA